MIPTAQMIAAEMITQGTSGPLFSKERLRLGSREATNSASANPANRATPPMRGVATACTSRSRGMARARQRIATLGADDAAELKVLVAEALEELPVADEDRALAALPPVPEEPPAVVNPNVLNLAAARAQTARLQARWMDLRQRIVL